jgi:hypothetical protein
VPTLLFHPSFFDAATLLAQASNAPVPQSAQVRLLMAGLVVLILLLGGLIVLTTVRRSLRMRREAMEKQQRTAGRESPWQAAGKRAKPFSDDDDPDKTRPMHEDDR